MRDESRFDWAASILGSSVAVLAFSAAWWIWPDDFADRPLSHLSLRDLFRMGMSGLCVLAGIFGIAGAIKDGSPRIR